MDSVKHEQRPIDDPKNWPFLPMQKPEASRKRIGRRFRFFGVFAPISFFSVSLFVNIFVIGIDQYFGGAALPESGSITSQMNWIGIWVNLIQPILGLVVLVAGVALYRHGTRLLKVSAWRFLSDPRPPVLFMRSFSFDSVEDVMRTAYFPYLPRPRFEDSLAGALISLGPILAIGRPNEKLPETGSDRIYLSDDDWKSAVSYFTERAMAVVILFGDSPGLNWEIDWVLRNVPLNRLLFCFPYINPSSIKGAGLSALVKRFLTRGWEKANILEKERQERYQTFCQLVAPYHGLKLPLNLGEAQYLSFQKNGHAILLANRRSKFQNLILSVLAPYRLLPKPFQPLTSNILIDHSSTLEPFKQLLS